MTFPSARIQAQLQSLAEVVAANKEFFLRLLVENDRSAPAVTEIAARFLEPMGFSVLEITDSSRTILSSGHFPASAGNKSMHQAGVLSKKLSAIMENIMGTPTLTMQAEYPFTIAGFNFLVSGCVKLPGSAPKDCLIRHLKIVLSGTFFDRDDSGVPNGTISLSTPQKIATQQPFTKAFSPVSLKPEPGEKKCRKGKVCVVSRSAFVFTTKFD